MVTPLLDCKLLLLQTIISFCVICVSRSFIYDKLQNIFWMKPAGKYKKCGVTFWKEIQISFYLLSVSGHFRDYWHNQDKCEAQNDRMKYHNCIQKHPLRVSAVWVHWRNILPSRDFFYKTSENHVLCIFFMTRTTKEKDGGKSCSIISVLVLAIRGQTLSCCQHRPRNYDYNNITVLSLLLDFSSIHSLAGPTCSEFVV